MEWGSAEYKKDGLANSLDWLSFICGALKLKYCVA